MENPIKMIRNELKMSLIEFASCAGVSVGTIQFLEKGVPAKINDDVLNFIMRRTEIGTDDLEQEYEEYRKSKREE